MIKQNSFFAVVLLLSALLVGCGGGGSGTLFSSTPPPPPAQSFTLQKTVYTVPADKTVTVTSVTPTTVVLTGAVPSTVTTGWTLINNQPNTTQFLRKVKSVTKSGSTYTFQTNPANLTDIFNDAQIHQIQQVAAAQLAKMQPAQPGVTFKTLGAPSRDLSYSNEITFNAVQISDAGGLNSVGQVDGKIDYSLGFETALDVGVHGILDLRPKINKFRVAPFLRVSGDVTVTGKTHGEFSKRVPIGLPFSFPIAGLGPVPVTINFQLAIELDGRLDINGKLHLSGGIDMSAGIDCTNDQWSTIHTFNHSFTVDPPHLYAQASLTLSALQPDISIGIPDIGNMYVRSDALRATVAFTYQNQPPGYQISSSGDFKFTAGGTIKLGPFTFFDGQVGAFQFGSFQIGSPIFLPSAQSLISYWSIKNNGTQREIYTMLPDGTNQNNVLKNPSKDQYQPSLSWDATKIVYGSGGSLWACNVDGTGDHKVLDASAVGGFGIAAPAWSPDGNTIVFNSSALSGPKKLYTVSATGANLKEVGDLAGSNQMATFSPDGTKLVYVNEDPTTFADHIYILDIATNKSTAIATNGSYYDPAYSPDGTQVVYKDTSSNNIYIGDSSGIGNHVVLTGDYFDQARFSPDGQQLVFEKGLFSPVIATSDLTGGNQHVVLNGGFGDGGYPTWYAGKQGKRKRA